MEPTTAPAEQPQDLMTRVVAMLKEDLDFASKEIRQAPVNGDDHDSWADASEPDAFDYLAQQLIQTIKGDDTETSDDEEDEDY